MHNPIGDKCFDSVIQLYISGVIGSVMHKFDFSSLSLGLWQFEIQYRYKYLKLVDGFETAVQYCSLKITYILRFNIWFMKHYYYKHYTSFLSIGSLHSD